VDGGNGVGGGQDGQVLYSPGHVPETVGELALFRTAGSGVDIPAQLYGIGKEPVVLVFEARLPEFDAIAFARMLRTMPAYRDLPILLLGGQRHSWSPSFEM
jgi:CheY-like chemotaxis protein